MASFKVSVCMITYGHEQYIKDAINGVLMQNTDFDIELIIADDCSADNTEAIVQDIVANHPNGSWLKYTRHSQNKGMVNNFVWALKQCTGEYIALCEGDDYWNDEQKLKQQVDFLETNPDFSICYHRVFEQFQTGSIVPEDLNIETVPIIYSIYDLASKNLMHTASVVFRNNIAAGLPEWFSSSPVGDYILHMLNAREGKIYYMPELMATYRRHSEGVWSTKSKTFMFAKWIKVIDLLSFHFENEDQQVVKKLYEQKLGLLDYLYVNDHHLFSSVVTSENQFMASRYFDLASSYQKLMTDASEMSGKIKASKLAHALLLKCLHSIGGK